MTTSLRPSEWVADLEGGLRLQTLPAARVVAVVAVCKFFLQRCYYLNLELECKKKVNVLPKLVDFQFFLAYNRAKTCSVLGRH